MAGFTLPQRFWSKVIISGPDDCWEWTARVNADGYGEFGFRGRKERAHRLVIASRGQSIDGVVVRHDCDNPRCVNPNHLLTGTHADNVRDRDSRGRGRWTGKKGESNSGAKLTEEIVLSLRAAYARLRRYPSGRLMNGEMEKLVSQFRLPRGTVRNIVEGYQWTHLEVA